MLDPEIKRVKFFNCGVPGYSFGEMPAWLRKTYRTYKITDAIYLLNLNDFSRRDTRYEGADNGMYRMFRRPLLMFPFFVGKACSLTAPASGRRTRAPAAVCAYEPSGSRTQTAFGSVRSPSPRAPVCSKRTPPRACRRT